MKKIFHTAICDCVLLAQSRLCAESSAEKRIKMNDNRVGTLRLRGDAAMEFVNSFFNPSAEDIAEHDAKIENINNTITVNKDKSGFRAEVEGLDLSFLNMAQSKEILAITVTIKIRATNTFFHDNLNVEMAEATINSARSNEFIPCGDSELINLAA